MSQPGENPPTDARWTRMASLRDTYGRADRDTEPRPPKTGGLRRWFSTRRRTK
jgi:hypothetical protein